MPEHCSLQFLLCSFGAENWQGSLLKKLTQIIQVVTIKTIDSKHVILGLTSEFLRWVVEVACVWLYHTAVINKSVDMTVWESSMIYTIKDFKTQYSFMKHFFVT